MVLVKFMYCKRCFNAKRPKHGDMCILMSEGGVELREARPEHGYQRFGFVPHIVHVVHYDHDGVTVDSICAIVGCGVDVVMKNNIAVLYTHDDYVAFIKNDEVWGKKGKEQRPIADDEPLSIRVRPLRKPVRHTFSIEDWKAFVDYEDEDYSL